MLEGKPLQPRSSAVALASAGVMRIKMWRSSGEGEDLRWFLEVNWYTMPCKFGVKAVHKGSSMKHVLNMSCRCTPGCVGLHAWCRDTCAAKQGSIQGALAMSWQMAAGTAPTGLQLAAKKRGERMIKISGWNGVGLHFEELWEMWGITDLLVIYWCYWCKLLCIHTSLLYITHSTVHVPSCPQVPCQAQDESEDKLWVLARCASSPALDQTSQNPQRKSIGGWTCLEQNKRSLLNPSPAILSWCSACQTKMKDYVLRSNFVLSTTEANPMRAICRIEECVSYLGVCWLFPHVGSEVSDIQI